MRGSASACASMRLMASTLSRSRSSGVCSDSSRRMVYNSAPLVDNVSFYDHSIEKYALMEGNNMSLAEMLSFGRKSAGVPSLTVQSALHVQSELPIRLARRLMDLQFLPHVVVTNPHVGKVYKAYLHAFNTLRKQERVTKETNAAFTALLKKMVDEHAPMIAALGLGLKECNKKPIVGEQLHLDSFLNTMLKSRIERRVLGEHHISLQQRREGWIGIMCLDLCLKDALEHAKEKVTEVCRETYSVAPQMTITGDLQAHVSYIPAHLDYMCFEVLKNASRAVVEKHSSVMARNKHKVGGARGAISPSTSTSATLPPIEIRICEGNQGVTVKISDQGGGIAFEDLTRIWQYGYTTVDMVVGSDVEEVDDLNRDLMNMNVGAIHGAGRSHSNPMAGLGFGLPLSRLYAQFLGGDLRLISVPGYGSDVHIYIPDLSDNRVLDNIII